MEAMRDVLRAALGDSLSTLPPLERLAAAWPVAAGHTIASHSNVIALEEGSATVEVDSAEWLAQLKSMGPGLREQLGRIAHVRLAAIHFQKKP